MLFKFIKKSLKTVKIFPIKQKFAKIMFFFFNTLNEKRSS